MYTRVTAGGIKHHGNDMYLINSPPSDNLAASASARSVAPYSITGSPKNWYVI